MRWWLPLKASTFTGPIDGLFLAILIITGIAFVLVEVGLIWFAIQYRQRPGRKAVYTHGNTRAVIIWTTTVPGTYELGCSQLCGLGHYRMRAQVTVHTQEDYDAWMKQAAQEASQ